MINFILNKDTLFCLIAAFEALNITMTWTEYSKTVWSNTEDSVLSGHFVKDNAVFLNFENVMGSRRIPFGSAVCIDNKIQIVLPLEEVKKTWPNYTQEHIFFQ